MEFLEWCWWTKLSTEQLRNVVLIIAAPTGLILAIWRSLVAQKQVKLAEAGQKFDRYQKGAAMLGDARMSVRQAGVYALQELTKEDPKRYSRLVVELLCSFVRDRSDEVRKSIQSGKTTDDDKDAHNEAVVSPADCQVAVQVLANIIMEGAKIAGATLPVVANLRNTYLVQANLEGAFLSGAYLLRADLTDVYLTGANLTDANLLNANLTEANLTEADLTNANLKGANLTDANLLNACLRKAYFRKANLRDAFLLRADLTDADLTEANLTEADLTDADLTNANVTKEQLESARNVDPEWFKQFEENGE